MGYYADLINEKKEKQNKVVKRGTFKSGNWWISQETAWPNRIVYSAHAEYTSGPYKGEHHGTDSFDSLEKAESYVKRLNSKEEKDNDKVVEKYSKYGATIEIIQTDSGKYRYRVSKNGKGHETFTVETSISAAEREAEYAAKNLQNEKEETENASEADIRAMYAQIQELKRKGIKGENIDKFYAAVNYREAAEQHRKKYKETGEIGYKWAAERADKQADQWVAEIKRSMRNEKEKGYYAKLIEEKKNLTYDVDKLAKQVKTWLDTGAYSEREIADKLEKDYGMPKSTANHILEKGKQLRAQA